MSLEEINEQELLSGQMVNAKDMTEKAFVSA